MNQPILPRAPRAHDLPPRWDGRRVEWTEWETFRTTMVYHGRSTACVLCLSVDEAMVTSGGILAEPGEVVPIRRPRTAYDALVNQRAEKRGAWIGVLYAFRCRECGHDQVLDGDDNWWDLEDSDYGDEGSVAP